jgi:hypothetical protein
LAVPYTLSLSSSYQNRGKIISETLIKSFKNQLVMSNDGSGTPAAESLGIEPRQSRTLTALVYQPYETGRLAYQFWRRSAIKPAGNP